MEKKDKKRRKQLVEIIFDGAMSPRPHKKRTASIVYNIANFVASSLKWPFARDTGWSESDKNQKS